jgi:hypothetical protein
MKSVLVSLALLSVSVEPVLAQETGKTEESPVSTVEITPAAAEAEVGEEISFTAVAKDAAGKTLVDLPSSWFAAPFDLGGAAQDGRVVFHGPGEVRIGAVIAGKTGYAKVRVIPPRVARIAIEAGGSFLPVGGDVQLIASALTSRDEPRENVPFTWTALRPEVAAIDDSGLVTAISPGRAAFRAEAEGASAEVSIDVVPNLVRRLALEPTVARARTGDVVRLRARATDARDAAVEKPIVRWSVAGRGAFVESDGTFVAERPGSYSVFAVSGDAVATGSILVTPRNAERELEVVGRVKANDIQRAEQWIFSDLAYFSSIADQLDVYRLSEGHDPEHLASLKVDARIINDVSVSADGRFGVLTREGASSRKNGIVILDTADPRHPKVLSEYTETVSGGVHSAFIDGHFVYLTDDATGSLRVIDVEDPKRPREVGRWQVENPLARTITLPSPEGEQAMSSGRYLHDVYVKDGLAYLAYWRDGLVILDVGDGCKGGTPQAPRLVSQLRFDYHGLYGDGWLAGAHAVFRYKDYVFVGDEVFPAQFDLQDRRRIPVRGLVFVVDVAELERPRVVAEYNVPEGGAHNIWIEDDVLYMGYYSGGGRILDVSGELRGDLYRQGREIARLWTGDPEGFRPNLPFTWGAQPHGGLIYFNDINSGLWIVKLLGPRQKGSAPAPGY